jgi:hypothetical protein
MEENAWWQIALLWVSLMSGALSLIREAIGMYRGEKIGERSAFWHSVFIGFVLSAMVVIWTRGNTIEQLRAALDRSKPDLSGAIERLSVGPAKNSPNDSLIIILAKIKNKSAPSSIDNLKAAVILASGRRVVVTPLQPPVGNFTLTEANGNATVLPPEKNLVLAGSTPIPTGGLLDGYICGLLQGVPISEANRGVPGVQLSFDDITGKSITVNEMGMSPTTILNAAQFFVAPNASAPNTH